MPEEIHHVKRAIIMAAGIGQRLRPLTFTTPKPLICVNGTRMIDTAVNGLRSNGIDEIHVVVGHLKEQFCEWGKEKDVDIIENPDYKTCNNISSLYAAREYLEDCMILDGDQMIYNPSVLAPDFTLSGYNAVWCEGATKEWLMEVRDGIVQSCSRNGGSRGWQLYSISRWTKEDGRKLRHYLEEDFISGCRQIFWDDVAMFRHFPEFRLGIREMNRDDVLEIDGLEELAAADPGYRYLLDDSAGSDMEEQKNTITQ